VPVDILESISKGSVIIPTVMTHPHITEFILSCARRAGNHWSDLYDEMCRSAAKKRFRGLGYLELKELGLALDLDSLDTTADVVDTVLKSAAVN
jgi:hypothetical protein